MVVLAGKQVDSVGALVELYQSRVLHFGFSSELFFYRNVEQHKRKLAAFARVLGSIDQAKSMSILEVGCGYGALLDLFTPGPRYLGIDLIPELIAEARRRHSRRGFVVGNVADIPSNYYDICVLAGVLSSVPQPETVLGHALRCAKQATLFDVTLYGRLEAEFGDLNRWTIDEALQLACDHGFDRVSLHDQSNSWVICSACRSRASPPPAV